MSNEHTHIFIGVDLHPKSFTACFMYPDGRIFTRRYNLKPWDIENFRKLLGKNVMVAVETTANADFFESLIEDDVKEVVRVNTRRFTLIRESLKKTDRNDARTLAFYLKKEVLPECRRKTPLQQEVMRLCNLHERWTCSRTREFNSIRDVYVRNGRPLDDGALSSRKKLLALDFTDFSESNRAELELYRGMAVEHYNRLRKVDLRIEELAVQLPGFSEIVRIKGVGTFTAAVVLATIGDISDFRNKKKLCSYIGLVPRVHQSESTVHLGGITKRGNPLARKTLIQAALVAVRNSPRMGLFHQRIKKKRGGGRANVAAARKLLDIIFDVLTKGWSESKEMYECRAA